MPRKRCPIDQIITKLREAETRASRGETVAQACKAIEVTQQTYYRWRKQCGGLKSDQAKRLKELEKNPPPRRRRRPFARATAEFTARAVREWLEQLEVKTLFIAPGSPWENGYNESLIGKLRDELLNGELIETLWEAQVLVEAWRKQYNEVRPHSSLGYRPPAPEAWEVAAVGKPSASLRSSPRHSLSACD